MKENVLTIKYSDDILFSLKETKEEFEEEARYLLALKLYELGKISSGKAAKIAGVSISKMMEIFKEYGVEANLEYEDYLKGLKTIRKIW